MTALSVIVPMYNESARIDSCLAALARWLSGRRESWELIAVDDGSTDDTPARLARARRKLARLRIVRLARQSGKGAAVRAGFKAARGRVVLFTDCDLSTPPDQIASAVRWIREGYDLAVGSRHLPGARLEPAQPPARRLAGRLFNLATRVLLGLPYADTQCGFKAVSRRAAAVLSGRGREPGFAFDVEWLLLARRHGLKVKEFPIRWRDRAESKVRLFRHAPAMFGALLRLQRRHRSVVAYHPVRALPLILFSCAGAVVGQIFYKTGAGPLRDTPIGAEFLVALLTTPAIWFGLVFFLLGAVTWLMALARVELSFAFPMLSLNFVLTALYAWLVFGERVAANRIAGIALVILGVLVIAGSGRPVPAPRR